MLRAPEIPFFFFVLTILFGGRGLTEKACFPVLYFDPANVMSSNFGIPSPPLAPHSRGVRAFYALFMRINTLGFIFSHEAGILVCSVHKKEKQHDSSIIGKKLKRVR